MLTRDMLRVRVRGATIVPSFIDPTHPSHLKDAQALVEVFQRAAAAQWTRGGLNEHLDDLVAERRDHKILRGLAKLLLDKATFAAEPPVPPIALRREVFLLAQARGPLALAPGPLHRPIAADILAEVGERHQLSGPEVADALYGDLKEAQRLTSAHDTTPAALLNRYNVALAQGVLLHATELDIHLDEAPGPRVKQLLRWVRFHQLIATAERHGRAVHLHVDGPMSLIRQSSRYGAQLARFLPALLLATEGGWRLNATVLWTKARHKKTLELTHTLGLVSHLPDHGAWRPKPHTHFEERFRAAKTGWRITDGSKLIPLGARRVLYPDYTLRHGGQVAHLQILGFWRKEALQEHLQAIEEHGPGNVIVAVSRRLLGDKVVPKELGERVIFFTEVLSVKRVLEAAASLQTP